MANNFHSIMSRFVEGVENSTALHGRILCTRIIIKKNELMGQGRISEIIHPVYKWQDASRTPGPGGRGGRRARALAAAPARSSPPPPLPGKDRPHRGFGPRQAGRRAALAGPLPAGRSLSSPGSGSAGAQRPVEPHCIFH